MIPGTQAKAGTAAPPARPSTPSARRPDPLQAWLSKLQVDAEGRIVNPDGIDAPDFDRTLEEIRQENRSRPPRDPFADAE